MLSPIVYEDTPMPNLYRDPLAQHVQSTDDVQSPEARQTAARLRAQLEANRMSLDAALAGDPDAQFRRLHGIEAVRILVEEWGAEQIQQWVRFAHALTGK